MATKYPLCLVVMELAAAMEAKGLVFDAAWSPREWNVEADALTNQRFEGFDPARQRKLDLRTHSWRLLDGLQEDGRDLYAATQEQRAAARLRHAKAPRSRRSRKEAALKERDPW
jgi:hypothetical protein